MQTHTYDIGKLVIYFSFKLQMTGTTTCIAVTAQSFSIMLKPDLWDSKLNVIPLSYSYDVFRWALLGFLCHPREGVKFPLVRTSRLKQGALGGQM